MRKKDFNNLRARAQEIIEQCNQTSAHQNISQLIDELTIYQIELEIQNDDLIKIQAELEESRSKYIELYDLAPVGYFAISKEGLITEVNQAGCVLLGLKKIALLKRCFSRYIVAEFQTLFSQYRQRSFKE